MAAGFLILSFALGISSLSSQSPAFTGGVGTVGESEVGGIVLYWLLAFIFLNNIIMFFTCHLLVQRLLFLFFKQNTYIFELFFNVLLGASGLYSCLYQSLLEMLVPLAFLKDQSIGDDFGSLKQILVGCLQSRVDNLCVG